MTEESAAPAPSSPWFVSVTDETFEKIVIEGSKERPVAVDFWAAWCGPCRMLGPLLEKLAEEYDGKFLLAKADTEVCQRAAMQFNVQSIPAVFSAVDGQVDDYFVGVLPEGQLHLWLGRMIERSEMAAARRDESGNPAAAEAVYRRVVAEKPNDIDATLGLARALLAQSKREEAQELIATLEKRGYLEPEAQRIKAQLDLGGERGDLAGLEKAAANRDDLPAQLRLAQGFAGAERFPEALDLCLTLVERDRPGVGEQARQLMIDIFRVLGPDSDVARDYRRKLTTLLY